MSARPEPRRPPLPRRPVRRAAPRGEARAGVLALVLCGALIAGVIVPYVRDRLPAPPAASSASVQSFSAPPLAQRNLPAPAAPVPPQATPAPSYPPDPVQARARQTLATLADTCAFWQREVAAGRNGSAMRDDACQRLQRFAAEQRLALPGNTVAAAGLPAAAVSRRIEVSAAPTVAVHDCAAWGPGSIAYRDCRQRERARLDAWCRQLNRDADRLGGEARQTALDWREAVCSAAERYTVMR